MPFLARPRVLLIAGAVLVALVFALSLIYFEVIPLSRVFSFRPTVGLGSQTPGALPACPSEKEGNPLVVEVAKTGDIVAGTLRGKIEKVDLSPTGKEGVFDIVSLDGKQTHAFAAEEKEGLVFDSVSTKVAQIADLKAGYAVSVDFSCNPAQAQDGVLNDFTVTRIVIVEK